MSENISNVNSAKEGATATATSITSQEIPNSTTQNPSRNPQDTISPPNTLAARAGALGIRLSPPEPVLRQLVTRNPTPKYASSTEPYPEFDPDSPLTVPINDCFPIPPGWSDSYPKSHANAINSAFVRLMRQRYSLVSRLFEKTNSSSMQAARRTEFDEYYNTINTTTNTSRRRI